MSHLRSLSPMAMRKADELAKVGAMLDEGFMAEMIAETLQQEREEVHAALQYAASVHCLVEEWKDCEEPKPKPKEKLIFADLKREEMKHQYEWCSQANKYRCMRCGWSSKYMRIARKRCTGPKYLSHFWGKCGNQTTFHHKTTGNRHDHVTSTLNHERQSWRFGTSTTLPGWRYHTGGSQSIPTVHPCPCEERLWVARRSVTTDNQDATTDEQANKYEVWKE